MHTSDQNPSSSPQTPAFYIALDIGGSKILAARGMRAGRSWSGCGRRRR
ncbi:MAG: hypothetical protein H6628_04080 [Calditrichae bacterium]|nr:hypothetical protein [Calditrichia bacterium]